MSPFYKPRNRCKPRKKRCSIIQRLKKAKDRPEVVVRESPIKRRLTVRRKRRRNLLLSRRRFYQRRRRIVLAAAVAVGVGLCFLFLAIFSGNAGKNHSSKLFNQVSPSSIAQAVRESNLKKGRKPYVFAEVPQEKLKIFVPASPDDVVAIGFHQADNSKAYLMQPRSNCLTNETTTTVRQLVSRGYGDGFLAFVMYSRGRGTPRTSAADIALKHGCLVRAPVEGIVTKIKKYYMYGRYEDLHVEIRPDKHPNIRVILIHLDKLAVKVGQRTKIGSTVIGEVRCLPKVNSQIDRYLPGHYDHTHLQVNPFIPEQ